MPSSLQWFLQRFPLTSVCSILPVCLWLEWILIVVCWSTVHSQESQERRSDFLLLVRLYLLLCLYSVRPTPGLSPSQAKCSLQLSNVETQETKAGAGGRSCRCCIEAERGSGERSERRVITGETETWLAAGSVHWPAVSDWSPARQHCPDSRYQPSTWLTRSDW